MANIRLDKRRSIAIAISTADSILQLALDNGFDVNEFVESISIRIHNKQADRKARTCPQSYANFDLNAVWSKNSADARSYASQLFGEMDPPSKELPDIPDLDDLTGLKVFETVYKNPTPEVDRVYYNEGKGATTVIWKDGTSTVVRCPKDQPFDKGAGFGAALAKKIYGSSSMVNKLVDKIKIMSEYQNFTNTLASHIYGKELGKVVQSGVNVISKPKKEQPDE